MSSAEAPHGLPRTACAPATTDVFMKSLRSMANFSSISTHLRASSIAQSRPVGNQVSYTIHNRYRHPANNHCSFHNQTLFSDLLPDYYYVRHMETIAYCLQFLLKSPPSAQLRLRGLEPLTFGSVDRRSIQLSYRRFNV